VNGVELRITKTAEDERADQVHHKYTYELAVTGSFDVEVTLDF
jgi:hypothetical protein